MNDAGFGEDAGDALAWSLGARPRYVRELTPAEERAAFINRRRHDHADPECTRSPWGNCVCFAPPIMPIVRDALQAAEQRQREAAALENVRTTTERLRRELEQRLVMGTYQDAPAPVTVCKREAGHDGPCNGLPRAERWGPCYQQQSEDAFERRMKREKILATLNEMGIRVDAESLEVLLQADPGLRRLIVAADTPETPKPHRRIRLAE